MGGGWVPPGAEAGGGAWIAPLPLANHATKNPRIAPGAFLGTRLIGVCRAPDPTTLKS